MKSNRDDVELTAVQADLLEQYRRVLLARPLKQLEDTHWRWRRRDLWLSCRVAAVPFGMLLAVRAEAGLE